MLQNLSYYTPLLQPTNGIDYSQIQMNQDVQSKMVGIRKLYHLIIDVNLNWFYNEHVHIKLYIG